MLDDWRSAGQTIEHEHRRSIEQQPDTDFPPAARRALAEADAVIYDPCLATHIKQVLPVGCYSEPWAAVNGGPEPALAPRAVKLATDGWRVAQLITPHAARQASMRQIVATDSCGVQVEVIACPGDTGPATIVLEPLGARHSGDGRVFTANGLAG